MFTSCGWWRFFSLSCCTREFFLFIVFITSSRYQSDMRFSLSIRCVPVSRCEQVVLASTSVLCAAVRLVRSSSLLDQLVHFLLRTETLTHLLLQRCDHISDQVSTCGHAHTGSRWTCW